MLFTAMMLWAPAFAWAGSEWALGEDQARMRQSLAVLAIAIIVAAATGALYEAHIVS